MTDIIQALSLGQLAIQGEFVWGSNYTFLTKATIADQTILCVYKPVEGERPLWDFPPASLARREVAAYLVSEALRWELVPPTVFRQDGPLGAGSVQLFIDHDPKYHYFNFTPQDVERLRPVALFDHLINNADRKGSHVLKDDQGHIWAIDHGVSFHVEDKLRTVIWDFVGEPLPGNLLADLKKLEGRLTKSESNPSTLVAELGSLLTAKEIHALRQRLSLLIQKDCFPDADPSRRPFPWPQI